MSDRLYSPNDSMAQWSADRAEPWQTPRYIQYSGISECVMSGDSVLRQKKKKTLTQSF